MRLLSCALTLNKNVPVLDGDLDALGDGELFLRVAVSHLSAKVLDSDVCSWWNLLSRRPLTGRKRENRAMRRFDSRVLGDKRTCTSSWRLLWVSDVDGGCEKCDRGLKIRG